MLIMKVQKNKISEEEMEARIEELYIKKLEEFDSFKKNIDELLFRCLVDIFRTKIISLFNQRIMPYLKPRIDSLMNN